MSQFQSPSNSSNNIATLIDPAIGAMEHQIGELKKTVASLAAEGHEVTDATKQLNEMIEKLRVMKSRIKRT